MQNLEAAFNSEMKNIYKKAAVHKIYFRRLNMMIVNHGGLKAAKKLVVKKGISKGFQRLLEIDKMELSVEYLVAKNEFRSLFTEKELESAKIKLHFNSHS